jgi:hypothetical protein
VRIIVRRWDEYPPHFGYERPGLDHFLCRLLCFALDNTVLRHEHAEESQLVENSAVPSSDSVH